ncbi:DUF5682 family protein [Paenibacillus solani]|uniref:DUF5682 family protein n=1 Tax=Paenibacillus solani TaxID=1705565 RepID=UPI003D27D92A
MDRLEQFVPGNASQNEGVSEFEKASIQDRVMGMSSGWSMDPSGELRHIFEEEVMNFKKGIVYFPVRHHSPACSYHVMNVIETYKPEIILIEGPESATPLIDILADQATEPPVSLYCTYEQGGERSAYYYPLLSYSPEYAALKLGTERQIPIRFIDLDYRHHRRIEERQGEASLQDETLLAGSEFMKRLCDTFHCRSFHELWEKLFEIPGSISTTKVFARNVFTYCTLSRLCYSHHELALSGDVEREEHMRMRIAEASRDYKRVLVITGGFHTYALLQKIDWKADPLSHLSIPRKQTATPQQPNPLQKENVMTKETVESDPAVTDHQVYPMVYTFAEADRLNGYASGMPYVNYYQMVWNEIQKRSTHPYLRAGLSFLAQLTRRLRNRNEAVSTSDAIEAYRMIQGLADLRGKREGGVFELLDASLSSFVKGEHTLASDEPLEQLARMLTGDKIGSVAPNRLSIPIVEDFKKRSAAFKLNLKVTAKHQKTLDLYAKPQHRRLSQWFHCVSFLVPDFAVRQTGPDWVAFKDMSLVRESWSYSYSSRIEARWIECSIYGGTVQEAAVRKIEQAAAEIPEHHSEKMVELLLQACLMGLEDMVHRLFDGVKAALLLDGSFLSLCRTLNVLNRMQQHTRLLGLSPDIRLPELIHEAFDQAVRQMLQLSHTHPDEHALITQSLKLLFMLSTASGGGYDRDTFRLHLDELLADNSLPAQLEGSCTAISVGLGNRSKEEIVLRAKGYMRGTPEKMRKTASYLHGVFAVARDALLYDDTLLMELNHLIAELPYEDFISMVPELRLAFTYFSPMEADMVAERVAKMLETVVEELDRPPVDEQLLQSARRMDQALREEFAKWSLT